ncbi:transcription factor [Calocera viscosa TUFC12733]|uniref:Transcription factor n=1 Tax=Calocera viscosa (strain TUFC12733) TaxID=1330018 RepID=A0A167PMR0_CALVF|nr:transcription factor [Calocera viscosa TUFC12733]
MSMSAIVKSVASGDTLVLRGPPGPNGQSPKERILHLADITAPRIGSATREDEPWAYESREFLRALAVGKQIHFNITHALGPSNDGGQRDIGVAMVGGADVASEILKNGWGKVKEGKRDENEEDQKRKQLEATAKEEGKGLWNPEGPVERTINYAMPTDPFAFLTEWKGKPIESLVEQVRDGDHLRLRLLLADDRHQFINISIAGIRCPRSSPKEGEPGEECGNEARFFSESRLLQRHVKTTLLSLPAPAATPLNANAAPAPPSYFIGVVIHPVGNIAEFLVQAGLAHVVGWHAGMLSSLGIMERLRAAEVAAKQQRLGVYKSTAPAASSTGPGPAVRTESRSFEGQVIRVWTGDQISVVEKSTNKERRIQLSSVRAARANDPKQAHWANEAREFLRKKLIGKHVRVNIDYIRPPEGEYEERDCATVRVGGGNANVAEQLIEKGFATAMRHRRDDENRSPDYDKFMAAEQAAVAAARGLHSPKEISPTRVGNASETHAKAVQFLSSFKRSGRVPAVVEYVAAGSRFKLYLPKENQTLTLVLAGIRAPRTARNPSETSEPCGPEALEFANRRFMQRDVEVEFDNVDKSGGFIGTMWVNKTENAALSLVNEGLASVHAYSAEGLSWSQQLYDAEGAAKKEKKNLWANHTDDAPVVLEVNGGSNGDATPHAPEYLDVMISDIRTSPTGTAFSVQILKDGGIAALEKMMSDFAIYNRTASSAPGFVPKKGDLVSAKFSADGQWYRAKVVRSSPVKKEAEITFIDYGNQDTVAFSQMRPLDSKFKALPAQATDARLSFVKLVGSDSEYGEEALQRFHSLCEGRKLIAITDYREGSLLHLRLIDPTSASLTDPAACINVDLVREGLAQVDKSCKYLASNPAIGKALSGATEEARRERFGIYEYGDVSED